MTGTLILKGLKDSSVVQHAEPTGISKYF